jgi:hypothetical protein
VVNNIPFAAEKTEEPDGDSGYVTTVPRAVPVVVRCVRNATKDTNVGWMMPSANHYRR